MSEALVGERYISKSWIGSGGLLDHLPILLKMEKGNRPPSPLKFNHAWLLEEDFKNRIIIAWTHVQSTEGELAM